MTKALTLHQPWASLVALGVKSIETRSWTTLYRGRLLIHAGTQRLPVGGVTMDGWLAINTITDPAYQGPQPCNPTTGRQRRIPQRAQTPTLMWPHAGPHHRPREGEPKFTHTEYLPMGAVVASCVLADVVPIPVPDSMRCSWDGEHAVVVADLQPTGRLVLMRGVQRGPCPADFTVLRVIEDQRPYGDFTRGRYAWLLDDIKATTDRCPACWGDTCIEPDCEDRGFCQRDYHERCSVCADTGRCDPVPARGRQQLWEWTP